MEWQNKTIFLQSVAHSRSSVRFRSISKETFVIILALKLYNLTCSATSYDIPPLSHPTSAVYRSGWTPSILKPSIADNTRREACKTSSLEQLSLASILATRTGFFRTPKTAQRLMAFVHSAHLSSGTSRITCLFSVAMTALMIDRTLTPSLVETSLNVTMATEVAWLSLIAAFARDRLLSTCLSTSFSSSWICSNSLSESKDAKMNRSDMKITRGWRKPSFGACVLLKSLLLRSVMKLQQFALGLKVIMRGSPEKQKVNERLVVSHCIIDAELSTSRSPHRC